MEATLKDTENKLRKLESINNQLTDSYIGTISDLHSTIEKIKEENTLLKDVLSQLEKERTWIIPNSELQEIQGQQWTRLTYNKECVRNRMAWFKGALIPQIETAEHQLGIILR